jgi:cell division protein ZapA
MCAFQFASQAEQKQIDNAINGEKPSKELKNQCALDQYLDN